MILGVIPARFASSRLPGKPLVDIGGKSMIQRTYESASKSKLLDDIIIAVDDKKVYDHVTSFGGNVRMTPLNVATGSDRVAFVADKITNADIIVNIQGDEPFIQGRMIDEAIEPLLFAKDVDVSTLARKVTTVEEYKAPSIPKVVFDYNNYALYFSRAPIPHVRDARTRLAAIRSADIFKHVGLYVYRRDALLKFTSLSPTDLEMTEKLEQLRMLENGLKIKIVVTEFDSLSVDTEDDLHLARRYYEKFIRPKE